MPPQATPPQVPTQAASNNTPLRRRPVQQRSTARVERMLEACAALVDEMGYERLTTTLIAERAGVAVGSLYQFFPDKRAVVQELTRRNLEFFVGAVRERFVDGTPEHWWTVIDSVIDIYVIMHREVPAFSKIHFGDVIDLNLLDEGRDNNAVISDALAGLVGDSLSREFGDIQLPIAIAVEASDALLRYAFRVDAAGDDHIIEETKTLVRDYLARKIAD